MVGNLKCFQLRALAGSSLDREDPVDEKKKKKKKNQKSEFSLSLLSLSLYLSYLEVSLKVSS